MTVFGFVLPGRRSDDEARQIDNNALANRFPRAPAANFITA